MPWGSSPTPKSIVGSLSVFFPAFNDAASLPGLIASTFEVLQRRIPDYEVIVVNDGSTDGTATV
ncbi:MAG: glycosyltransferase, partial [Acidobacteriota bacterium]|nr:glycosyltransferase [Acidobacteriota bacterium]